MTRYQVSCIQAAVKKRTFQALIEWESSLVNKVDDASVYEVSNDEFVKDEGVNKVVGLDVNDGDVEVEESLKTNVISFIVVEL